MFNYRKKKIQEKMAATALARELRQASKAASEANERAMQTWAEQWFQDHKEELISQVRLSANKGKTYYLYEIEDDLSMEQRDILKTVIRREFNSMGMRMIYGPSPDKIYIDWS